MTPDHDEQSLLRVYLLGHVADESVCARIEERLLADEAYFEALLIAEEELLDDYVRDALTPAERASVEQHFLTTPERQQQLTAAQALHRYVAQAAAQVAASEEAAAADGST